jgi:hypothetical protein
MLESLVKVEEIFGAGLIKRI